MAANHSIIFHRWSISLLGGPRSPACHAHPTAASSPLPYNHAWAYSKSMAQANLEIELGNSTCTSQFLCIHSSTTAWQREYAAWDSSWFSLGHIIPNSKLGPYSPISMGSIQQLRELVPTKLRFCFEEGGDSDEGVAPPIPRLRSTKGRAALPSNFSIKTHL